MRQNLIQRNVRWYRLQTSQKRTSGPERALDWFLLDRSLQDAFFRKFDSLCV